MSTEDEANWKLSCVELVKKIVKEDNFEDDKDFYYYLLNHLPILAKEVGV